ncbi:hypothetical protein DBR32_09295 [Taibaiella sp. KBW10]|uniref:hypothetical protein n=1 Tax=Taibaiella sp. KBW10 TaxID=2153357 RepID=UPI000F5A8EED|nr:hypothetical protein [Taibaiella sp. KBW10]RQO31184.1 hypothetical protein DBR32_09295 [Taibaiella sp. KBW10]
MKKVIFSVMALAGCLAVTTKADAQLQKGTFLVGGQLANINFGLGSSNSVSLDISPKVGYFIQNNLALGLEVPLGFTAIKGIDPTFRYGIGAFGRYYFAPKEFNIDNILNRGRFFGEAGVGIAGQTDVEVGFNIKVGAGYAYFITPNVALETLVRYQGTYGTGNTSGLGINLGFQIHLPSKKIKSEYYQIKKDVETKRTGEE